MLVGLRAARGYLKPPSRRTHTSRYQPTAAFAGGDVSAESSLRNSGSNNPYSGPAAGQSEIHYRPSMRPGESSLSSPDISIPGASRMLSCLSLFTILVRRLRVAASRVSLPSHYLLSVSARSVWPSTIFCVRSRATQGAWWGRLHLTLGRGDLPRDPVGLRHAPSPHLLFPAFLPACARSDFGDGSLR